MEQWKGKVAVVTGASSGIGAAIVKDLAKGGIIVIGLARRKQRIEDLKKELGAFEKNLHSYECDVSKEECVKAAFKWIEEKFGGVNIMINNAGIINFTSPLLTDSDSNDDIRAIVDTNLMGLMYCTREAYKLLKKHDAMGYIININSVVGHSVPHFPGRHPPYNIYPATKHAVTAATEVIRQELVHLKNQKVRITSVSPGYVDTEIAANSEIPADFPSLKAEDISQCILYLLSTPQRVSVKDILIKPTGEMC